MASIYVEYMVLSMQAPQDENVDRWSGDQLSNIYVAILKCR